jgi:hypothetical protein
VQCSRSWADDCSHKHPRFWGSSGWWCMRIEIKFEKEKLSSKEVAK